MDKICATWPGVRESLGQTPLIAQKYDGTARRRRGRPLTPEAMAELVVRMAVENPLGLG